jgi:serine/threonine protein kinase
MSQILQNYRIISTIGEGGMGIVYLAEHISLRRKVAIKALHQNLSSNQAIRQRFINEGITLSNLNHPNIVILYDFIDLGNTLYLVMEYVEGQTLDKLIEINSSPLSEERAIPIFKKVLSGFNYAHNKGIIHRDIKPSNIIINPNDEPKILDFGIAKILESNVRITSTGMRLGSIMYMSPEQILGKDVDLRTDIYSLGVTLFEILTAAVPYSISTESEYEIQTKIIKETLLPVSLYNQNISPNINNIIQKATAKNPEDRFRNCEEFSLAFDAIIPDFQNKDYQKTQINTSNTYYSNNIRSQPATKKSGISTNRIIGIISAVAIILITVLITLIVLKVSDKQVDDEDKQHTIKVDKKVSEQQPPNTTENKTDSRLNFSPDSPAGRMKKCIESLGNQEFYTAYEIFGGSYWGSYQKFSSTGAYGGISRTFIYDIYEVSNTNYEATVFVDYDSYDPYNNDARYKQYFYMVKRNGQWVINKSQKPEAIYYRKVK